jgi:hypothetical protein
MTLSRLSGAGGEDLIKRLPEVDLQLLISFNLTDWYDKSLVCMLY